ncbi:MAG: hypothetical protein U9Q85_02505 [Patescibacteria group bacterium]|nr:hypothetical protein [Patescibacteria group bacterium]
MRRIFLFSALFIFGMFCFTQNVLAQNYEVLFDSATSTVVKIYSEAGDGTVGFGNDHSSVDWDYYHNSLNGGYVSYLDDFGIVGCKIWSWGTKTPQIYRGFLPFDTSFITEDVKIINSSLYIYVSHIANSDNDGNDFLNIVNASQQDYLSLHSSDYSKCGNIHNAVEGAQKFDLGDIAVNKYNAWKLNSVGLSWIVKNGITKLGLREGHDLLDDPLDISGSNRGHNRINFSTSEDSGINKRPYLLIHYKKEKNPVIVIPGIAGSWFSNKNGWQMDPILHTYDDLIGSLEDSNYEEESTLFPMPYNWKQDNTFSAYELGQLIDQASSLNKGSKVDIVAHSMGGIVARKYLEDSENLDKVDKLIFLGTPHQGAPKAYPIWEAGEGFDSLSDKALRSIIKFEAESSGGTLLEYIRNGIASLHQLLPSYQYLQDGSTWRDYDAVNNPDNYPYNNWLTDLNDDNNLIALNNSGVNIYNLRGDSNNTITLYEVDDIDLSKEYWPHGKVITAYKGAGDGTVPEASSDLFTSTLVPNASHRLIPAEAREQVIAILTGVATSVPTSQIPAIEHLMTIGVYSPVDFFITTPSGQKIGRNFPASNEINEVPLAFYSGVNNENEYATLLNPEAGEYIMEILGTGNGKYKIGVDVSSDVYGESIDNYKQGNIQVGQSEIYLIKLNFDDNKNPQIEITKQNDNVDYFGRVNELCISGEISKRLVCRYLKIKYRFLEKKIKFYNKTDRVHLKRAIKRSVYRSIKKLKRKIEFFNKKNWMTDYVRDLLKDDLRNIKSVL